MPSTQKSKSVIHCKLNGKLDLFLHLHDAQGGRTPDRALVQSPSHEVVATTAWLSQLTLHQMVVAAAVVGTEG